MKAKKLPLFLHNATFKPQLDGQVNLVRCLETERDLYLSDHKLDGRPVLPMAMAMEMMAEAISRDMEEVIVNGDVASADPFLAVMDGVLKQSTSNVVDAAANPISKDLMSDMLKTLPSEHLRDKKAMRFLSSVDADLDYRNTLAERATAVGAFVEPAVGLFRHYLLGRLLDLVGGMPKRTAVTIVEMDFHNLANRPFVDQSFGCAVRRVPG